MFSQNLKILRKQKGFTQEALAAQLNVTRQTISKWEKDLSVPDADLLVNIAEIFEVPISSLLGGQIENENDKASVAEYLAQIAEQLAIKNRHSKRIQKIIFWIIVAAILLILLGYSA